MQSMQLPGRVQVLERKQVLEWNCMSGYTCWCGWRGRRHVSGCRCGGGWAVLENGGDVDSAAAVDAGVSVAAGVGGAPPGLQRRCGPTPGNAGPTDLVEVFVRHPIRQPWSPATVQCCLLLTASPHRASWHGFAPKAPLPQLWNSFTGTPLRSYNRASFYPPPLHTDYPLIRGCRLWGAGWSLRVCVYVSLCSVQDVLCVCVYMLCRYVSVCCVAWFP